LNLPLNRNARGLVAGGAAVLCVLALAAFAVASRSPDWTLVFAGGLLLAGGFVVMAPCQLQMSATLTVVLRNLAARRAEAAGAGEVRRSAMLFALGYVLFYLPVAAVLGGAAWLLGRYAAWLAVLGGLMAVVLGLAVLGVLKKGWLARCRGPLYLIRSGRASFQKPLKAGVAFGQYCATCCGPYLYALVVLAGATGSFALGSGLVVLYAATMVVPFLLPVLLAPGPYAAVMDLVQAEGPRLEKATGLMLVGVGLLLLPISLLLLGS
jgi:cytochrome c-type biogenesis protein